MSTDFMVVCEARRDLFDLGSGPWGWHYIYNPENPALDPARYDPSIQTLLKNGLHRDSRQEFAEYIVRLWHLGYVEETTDGDAWIRGVGERLFDYCSERNWEVVLLTDCDGNDEIPWWDYTKVGSRYLEDEE